MGTSEWSTDIFIRFFSSSFFFFFIIELVHIQCLGLTNIVLFSWDWHSYIAGSPKMSLFWSEKKQYFCFLIGLQYRPNKPHNIEFWETRKAFLFNNLNALSGGRWVTKKLFCTIGKMWVTKK